MGMTSVGTRFAIGPTTVLYALALFACSSDAGSGTVPLVEDAGPDVPSVVDAGVDAGPPLAPFVYSPPQLHRGPGPVMAAPKVVPVFATGDEGEPAIRTFLATPAVQAYFGRAVSEYGVGAMDLQATKHFASPPPATVDDAAIQTMLIDDVTDFPGGDDTLYLLYYPATTALTADGATLCTDLGAYHDAVVRPDGTHVVYAVVPRCKEFGFYTGFYALTVASAHEIAEAFTNPLGWTTKIPALAALDDDHSAMAWARAIGFWSENADLCAAVYGSAGETAHVDTYLLPRLWSNAAAKAGHDPCIGGDTEIYATLEPVIATRVTVYLSDLERLGLPAAVSVPSVIVKAGDVATVRLHAYSDGPSPPWRVFAEEYTDPWASRPAFPVSLDKNKASRDEDLTLTISPAASVAAGTYVVALTSQVGTMPQLTGFFVFVTK